MDTRDEEKTLITNQELTGIGLAAIKRPSKDGSLEPRIIRCFLEYIHQTYGIDLQIETEDMKNERIAKSERQSKKRSKGGGKRSGVVRGSFHGGSNDF